MEELKDPFMIVKSSNVESETETINSKDSNIACIRTEVQNKGLCLSETWSELFNLLTKYQGELYTKENALIAKERNENVPVNFGENGAEANNKINRYLRSEVCQKDCALAQVQEELCSKNDLLKQCQHEMLNKEHQVLQLQSELRQTREDNHRLEVDLKLIKKDLSIKDNLIDKVQTQMVKEINDLNGELKKLQQNLEQEKQQNGYLRQQFHGIQKSMTMVERCENQNSSMVSSSTLSRAPLEMPDSMDIPDVTFKTHDAQDFVSSYPTDLSQLDVASVVPVSLIRSVENEDFGKFPTNSDPVAVQNVQHDTCQERHLQNLQDQTLAYGMTTEFEKNRTVNRRDGNNMSLSSQSGCLPSMDWFATPSELVGTADKNFLNSNPSVMPTFTYSNNLERSACSLGNDTNSATINSRKGSTVALQSIPPSSPEKRFSPQQNSTGQNGFNPVNINVCKTCSQAFASLTALHEHEASKHYKGAYPCNICGKAFTHPSNRYRHMLAHKGIQKHQCKICPRKFSRRDNLQCHMASHYKITPDGVTLLELT